ncbi:MAG: hypothetical protein J0I19_06140 [Alphaproteobacteria bacterium]|nr:hypothetical protein [Alphaproteobacteria bacterium]
MKHLKADELVRIVAAGGGMKIDSRLHSPDDLTRIAAAASGKKAHIHFSNCVWLTVDQLTRIAAAGQGAVFFSAD